MAALLPAFALLGGALAPRAAAQVAPEILNGEECTSEDQGVRLQFLTSFRTGIFDESAAESLSYDAASQTAFFTSAAANAVEALDISGLAPGAELPAAEALPVPDGFIPNSVSVSDGIVAVALAREREFEDGGATFTEEIPGAVGFYKRAPIGGEFEQVAFADFADPATQAALLAGSDVQLPSGYAGVNPDMLIWTPEGGKVLVAIEGQPTFDEDAEEVAFDRRNPEGSLIIITVDRSAGDDELPLSIQNAHFRDLGLDEAFSCAVCRGTGAVFLPQLYADGREFGGAVDVEPEFVAVSDDGATAYVMLQENNAVAIVDVASAAVTSVVGLGMKDHGVVPIDAADNGEIALERVPGLFSLRQPDAAVFQSIGGKGFVLTANEGDSRDGESTEVSELDLSPALQAQLGPELAARAADEDDLGGLRVHASLGLAADGSSYDKLVTYGARSFSILDARGRVVYDSGDAFERLIADLVAAGKLPEAAFNADNDGAEVDQRSDRAGPEPEAIDAGVVGGATYAFVGLERNSGLVVFDVSSPREARLLQYVARRNFAEDAEEEELPGADLGPEYVVFVAEEDSPIDAPIVIVSNEVSGSISFWKVDDCSRLAGMGMPGGSYGE